MSKIVEKIKKIGFRKTVKLVVDEIVRPYVPGYHKKRWKKAMKGENYLGITSQKRDTEIIVSLTTYPARISYIDSVIKTLLTQTVKPDRIILWLAEEQFPNKEQDLPGDLTSLCKYGLTISWCNDIQSYKKLIPSIKTYPSAVIITADDDMYYHPRMVERLYKEYLKNPELIHCHRVSKFYMQNGEFKTVAGGYDIYSHPSYLHKLTGCSGTCYPPHSLYPDICREDLFMRLAPTNDDIWFWLMALLNGRRCNVVKHSCTALYFVEGSQTQALNHINDQGEKLFWVQFRNILDNYPQIESILLNEWDQEQV